MEYVKDGYLIPVVNFSISLAGVTFMALMVNLAKIIKLALVQNYNYTKC
jgi:hypothetical protein